MPTKLKLAILLFIVLQPNALFAALPGVIPYDSATMTFAVSAEQAESAAKAWSNVPDIAMTLQGVRFYQDSSGITPQYVFVTPDEVQEFDVSTITGEVESWKKHAAIREYDIRCRSANPGQKMSEEDLADIVRAFLAEKYPDFASLNMTHCWNNTYARRLSNGVWDYGFLCQATVDEYTGEILSYFALKQQPLTISPNPTISQETAAAIAVGAFSDRPELQSVFVLNDDGVSVMRDEAGGQRLVWTENVVISEDGNYTLQQHLREAAVENSFANTRVNTVLVDANTGEVVFVGYTGSQGSSGTPKNRATNLKTLRPIKGMAMPYKTARFTVNGNDVAPVAKPIIINGTPYLYVRYLSKIGLHIDWKDSRINITGAKTAELTPGSLYAGLDGERVKVTQPVKVIFDRAYLPLGLINKLSGNAFDWDRRNLTLNVRIQKKIGCNTLDSKLGTAASTSEKSGVYEIPPPASLPPSSASLQKMNEWAQTHLRGDYSSARSPVQGSVRYLCTGRMPNGKTLLLAVVDRGSGVFVGSYALYYYASGGWKLVRVGAIPQDTKDAEGKISVCWDADSRSFVIKNRSGFVSVIVKGDITPSTSGRK